MKNRLVTVPTVIEPISRSPGFAKKLLATYHLELLALCGFGCSYCSSNAGNYLRIRRARFADLTETQLGERLLPADAPDLAFIWPDIIERLEAQLARHTPSWGMGETLVFSQLTDPFSGPPLRSGITRRALDLLFARTSFTVRILTKNSVVGLSRRWRDYLADHAHRVVVGLSTGSLDPTWARQVEHGCPPPAARLAATRALQDAGVPTFGMLCPVFPDVLSGARLDDLVSAIRPARVDHLWAEPYNDRTNWQRVRAGYPESSPGYAWFTNTYERGARALWSRYATDLYLSLSSRARAEGWLQKLRYLLYEDGITPEDARRLFPFDSILFQNRPASGGSSPNLAIARLQGELPPTQPATGST